MTGLLIASLAALSVQSASEVEAGCEAFKADHGGEVDCVCFSKLVAADEELLGELAKIETPEDLDGASNKMKLTLSACSEK